MSGKTNPSGAGFSPEFLVEPRHVDEFQRNGFTKFSNVIAPDYTRSIRASLARLTAEVARRIDLPNVAGDDDALIDRVLPDVYRANPRAGGFIYDTINAHASVWALYNHPSIVDIAASFLNVDDTRIVKHGPNFVVQIGGDDRNMNGWHQESGYYCDFLSAEKSVLIWIPVSDIDLDGGALWVVPESHRGGALAHRGNAFDGRKDRDWDENGEAFLAKSQFQADRAVQIEARAGDVIAADFNTIHKSGLNAGPATRLRAILRVGSYTGRNFLPKYELPAIIAA